MEILGENINSNFKTEYVHFENQNIFVYKKTEVKTEHKHTRIKLETLWFTMSFS